MKTLPLLVCLAATTAASAADLKNPATVAREWNQAVEQSRAPATPPQSLMAQSDALTLTPLERIFSGDNLTPPSSARPKKWKFDDGPKAHPLPREPLLDAPRNQPPPVLPDNLPVGSKLWEFNGQKFWLVPLRPDTIK